MVFDFYPWKIDAGEWMKKHIANIITFSRGLICVYLFLCPVFSVRFYAMYVICGFTDMIDGTIARKTNSVTSFGSWLDSIADLMFVTVASIKIMPVIHIPNWLWIWIIIIFIMKIIAGIWRYILGQRFIFQHTSLNKITGFLLFILPLSLGIVEIGYSASVVCTVAFLSAIQELKVVAFNDNGPFSAV